MQARALGTTHHVAVLQMVGLYRGGSSSKISKRTEPRRHLQNETMERVKHERRTLFLRTLRSQLILTASTSPREVERNA